MNKEIKYGGYAADRSGYECPDGDLDAVMDLWPEGGSLKPVLQPRLVLQLQSGQKVLFVHKPMAGRTNYIIFADGQTPSLSWIQDGVTTAHQMSLSGLSGTVISANAVGNTLMIMTTTGIRYYQWKSDLDDYKYLGTNIPELELSFGLQAEVRKTDEWTVELVDTFVPGNPTADFSDDNRRVITDSVLAKVNKFIADESTNAGRFLYPFLIRYAYRLFDGTLTMHSAPVLMLCSSATAPVVFCTSPVDGITGLNSLKFMVAGSACMLDWTALDSTILQTLKNDWSDIVKSVDIFISAPQYTYDMSGVCRRLTGIDLTAFGVSKMAGPCDSSWASYLPYTYAKREFVQQYAMQFLEQGDNLPSFFCVELPEKSLDAVRDCSLFYFLKSVDIENVPTTRTKIEISSDYLQSLVNRELMTDDYDSHDHLAATYNYVYNQRLNLANVSKSLFRGFQPAAAFAYTDKGTAMSYTIYVFIRQGGKEYVVQSQPSLLADTDAYMYFYYPNPNAYKAVIKRGVNYYAVPMHTHDMLSGSYFFTPDMGWDTASVPTATTDNVVDLPNKMYTSEVGNPFLFPLAGINTVGTGEILGICSAAKALSEGQFGQFPLYVFSTDGVWAMEVSSTGTYSARQPITRDVCIDPESITQIDSAVLFATDRGVMVLSGSNADCITGTIDNKEDDMFRLGVFPIGSAFLDNDSSAIARFNYVPFRTFLKHVRMGYDYRSQRLVLFSKNDQGTPYPYAYLFAMDGSKRWGMMRSTLADPVNSYPQCLVQTSDNKLVDLSVRGANGHTTDGKSALTQYMVTRPLKLDSPDILKTVNNIIQRGFFAKGHVATVLWGSRDLINWYPIASSTDHYLRGFSGTPYKYFRVGAKCRLRDNESLSGCSVQFDMKETNQPR